MSNELHQSAESWGSRSGFVLAAIGSAVGLGNLWRFPHEAYSNGGGAFLVPYIVAMIVIGIPILTMELSLGHFTQRAATGAFGHIHRRWAFVGWWQVLLSSIIFCYYAVVLAWCLNYLYFSFSDPLPWAANAKGFFFDNFLQFNGTTTLGTVRWPIVIALFIIWLLMYFCIFKGVRLVSKIVLWTVPLPWIMLVILTIRGVSLDGAVAGLEYYLEPDWSLLARASVWRAAFGQVFFSMTIGFGVMITYAGFLHRKSDLNNNALVIGLADLATSFMAGIAVFATMGAMAVRQNIPVTEVLDSSRSIGLAFVAFPEALSLLPGAHIFSILFFTALLLLGLDSAFSLTELALACVMERTHRARPLVLAAISLPGFLIGIIFCTQGGLTWLDVVDTAVNKGIFSLLFLGLLECLVIGWSFDIFKLRRHSNHFSDWSIGIWWVWVIRIVAPVILGTLWIWHLVEQIKSDRGLLIAPDGTWIITDMVALGILAAAGIGSFALAWHYRHAPEPEALS